jgi:hypothetical protein
MRKMILGGIFIGVAMSFTACTKTQVTPTQQLQPGQTTQTSPTTTQTQASSAPGATEKSGTTTKSGKIAKAGNSYLLQVGTQSIGIDSYSIDLSQYVGQQVTVSGQYSGDTLFVTSVQ